MIRHPIWRPQRSRLAPLIHTAPTWHHRITHAAVTLAGLLLAMMLLRVALAWSDGRLG